MKCQTCGNPVPRGVSICPYCESPLTRLASRPREPLRTVNVKKGNPPAELAADQLESIINNARAEGTSALVVIHGYGSTGTGGSIRRAVRTRLRRMQLEGTVTNVIPGEIFGPSNKDAIRLASDHQKLLAKHLFGAGNEGVTVVRI